MPSSPFSLFFDHLHDCQDGCEYPLTTRLCLTGRLLFNAARDAAAMIAGNVAPEAKASA